MSDQASEARVVTTNAFSGTGSLFQEAEAPQTAAGGPLPAMSRPPPGLLPSDLLPEEARKDPAFRDGTGAMYAAAQPALAYKYGIMRNKQRIPPQQLGQTPKGLSLRTIADLKTLQDLQKNPPPQDARSHDAAEQDKQVMHEAAAGSAGMAGRLGNSPTDGPQPDPKPSKTVADVAKNMDDFDFNMLREVMMKDIINNEDQRKIIEERCEPLTIDDLITKGFVSQRVPIIPGKFEPTFCSLSGEDDLALKRLVMVESRGLEVSERYLLDKFSLMTLVAGLYALNGNPVPDFHDKDGHFDEDTFWLKFKSITKYPFHMLASIGVNYFWFDIRVRKLFVADNLGNG